MERTHLWRESDVQTDDDIVVTGVLESPRGERSSLWYRLPLANAADLTPTCDPLLVGTVLLAMKWGAPVHVHGQVSPMLLRNLEEFQAAWSAWEPERYRCVPIQADREREPPPASGRSLAAFSGGVDSSFTVYRHCTGTCGRWQRSVKAGLMVLGLDIPLSEKGAFMKATERAAAQLATLGVTLIPMATNFRQLPLKWEDAFGAGLASCLLLLQGGYSSALVASSFPYQALSFPYGSNPVTDWMLSTGAMETVHDGAAFRRIDKMRVLAAWPAALKYLRVCWEGPHKDRNCGRCEKCVRTILAFRVLGVPLPECFEADLTDEQIRDVVVSSGPLTEMQRVLEAAKAAVPSEPWVRALQTCIDRNLSRVRMSQLKESLRRRLVRPVIQMAGRLRRA
jgi:hypothetical protein